MDGTRSRLPLPERLPAPPPQIGLTLEQAAIFLGITVTRFEEEVEAGRLPKGIKFGRTRVWHAGQLRQRFDEIFGVAESRTINLDDEL